MTFLAKAHKPHASTKNDSNVAAPATAAFWIPASATRSPISALCTNVFLCALLKTNKKPKPQQNPPKANGTKNKQTTPNPTKTPKQPSKTHPEGNRLDFPPEPCVPVLHRSATCSPTPPEPQGKTPEPKAAPRGSPARPALPRSGSRSLRTGHCGAAAPFPQPRPARTCPATVAHSPPPPPPAHCARGDALRSARRRVAPARQCPLRRSFPSPLPGPHGTPGVPPPRPPAEVSRGHVHGADAAVPARGAAAGVPRRPPPARLGAGARCLPAAGGGDEDEGAVFARKLRSGSRSGAGAAALPPGRWQARPRRSAAPVPPPRGARGRERGAVCGARPARGHRGHRPARDPRSPGRLQRLPGLPALVSLEQPPPSAPGAAFRASPAGTDCPRGEGAPATARACRGRGAGAPSTAEACRCIGSLHHTCISVYRYKHTPTYPDLTYAPLPVELT